MKCYDWNLNNKISRGNFFFKFKCLLLLGYDNASLDNREGEQFSELYTLGDEGITFFRMFEIRFLGYAASYSGRSEFSNKPN